MKQEVYEALHGKVISNLTEFLQLKIASRYFTLTATGLRNGNFLSYRLMVREARIYMIYA